jgi:hypothetical protein
MSGRYLERRRALHGSIDDPLCRFYSAHVETLVNVPMRSSHHAVENFPLRRSKYSSRDNGACKLLSVRLYPVRVVHIAITLSFNPPVKPSLVLRT